MKKKNGFTLIELLAVIVILALIALIAIPMIMNVIESSRKGAYTESLRNLIKAAEYYEAREELDGNVIDFENGLSVFDTNIEMKNKSFITGTIKKNEQGELYLDMVSDGVYCGMGTIDKLNVTKGSCGELDTVVPSDIVIVENRVTSNSITIAVTVTTGHSGIKYYEYSSDGGKNYISSTSSSYTFTGLTKDTNYEIKVKVTAGNNLTGESEVITIHTSDVDTPTYSIEPSKDVWSVKKTVTITYPNMEGYKKEYSLDKGATWIKVTETTKEIEFIENGTVIARLTDGVNEIVGESFVVSKIDITIPTIVAKNDSLEYIEKTDKEITLLLEISNFGESGGTVMCKSNENIVTNLNQLKVGDNPITCEAITGAGNKAEVSFTVKIIQKEYVFDYTGSSQTFTVPRNGVYQVELWGAKGSGLHAGNGAYTKGNIELTEKETYYIYVGGMPNPGEVGYNGGGTLKHSSANGGGGATDMRLVGGEWSQFDGLKSRIMVSAGGGGCGLMKSSAYKGGAGGTLIGLESKIGNEEFEAISTGGTQTNGGTGGVWDKVIGGSGTFGIGGEGTITARALSDENESRYGASGGGGYYGGAGGPVCQGNCSFSGSGGSSFISGYTGCDAIASTSTKTNIVHTGSPNHYSGKVFSNTMMIAGDSLMPNPRGTNEITGNGYARITLLELQ